MNTLNKADLVKALESKRITSRPMADYKRWVREHYDGPAGAFTAVTGLLTGHDTLAGQLIRPGQFDVRGCKSLLDAGCGNGRYSQHMLKHADADARLTAFDLSPNMLERARRRVNDLRATYAVADVTKLPYADESFDAAVCGWVIEHLPDPRLGLRELARVMSPGAKLLLMTTENTVLGAWCSRLWHCRTYGRAELQVAATDSGFTWDREVWFSKFHERFKLGGIVVQLRRR
jgi:ubiquinone/menaquinone biosynthesis C-methylase UbiE